MYIANHTIYNGNKIMLFFFCLLDGNDVLLDKAMKKGFVTVEFSKFSISGAPGTGKSSFLRLLYNDEPSDSDKVHNSTNVVAPHPAHIITAIKGDDQKSLWKKVESDDIKEIIVGNIKNNMEILPEVKSHQVGNDVVGSSIKEPVATESYQPLPDTGTKKSNPITTTEDKTKHGVSQHIMKLLDHVQESKELYQSHWIYGIDTGGQAAFIDIAPALLQYNSVNIFTHKLDERLDDKAKFFFSVQGNVIGDSVERQITNLQLLEALFRSLTSVNPLRMPENKNEKENVQKPRCIVLGTYYDKLLMPHYSGELIETKNSILWSKLGELNLKDQAILYCEKENAIIFPVNAIARDKYEKELADEIRCQICKYSLKVPIPIQWFLFKLDLDQKFCQSNIFVVSKSKCQDIGKSLEMKADDVEAALMYYHNLTVFLYFPDILPDVVFLHPQPLFTLLISISFAETIDHFKVHGIEGNRIIIRPSELKDEGCFTRDLLSLSLFNGFSDDFTADNFLHLMTSLHIMAYLHKEEKYFIPSVLPTLPSTNYDSIPSAFKQHVDPLIISWDMKPFPRGIFHALVVNLLCPKNQLAFQLKRPLRSTPRYRNVITLKTNYGDVLLVDGIYWIAIYYSGVSTECFTLRYIIYTGINEVISKFQYMTNVKSVDEYFYCTRPNCPKKASEHFCHLSEDKLKCICQDSSQITDTDESRQLPWFRGEF